MKNLVILLALLATGCEMPHYCAHFYVYANDGLIALEHIDKVGNRSTVGYYKKVSDADAAAKVMNDAAKTDCEARP